MPSLAWSIPISEALLQCPKTSLLCDKHDEAKKIDIEDSLDFAYTTAPKKGESRWHKIDRYVYSLLYENLSLLPLETIRLG